VRNKKLKDKSKRCGLKFETKVINRKSFEKYFDKYCSKCKHMCEICMYGEIEEVKENEQCLL